jgi:hypothetical protein
MAAVMGNHLNESELRSIVGGAAVDLVFIVIMVAFIP